MKKVWLILVVIVICSFDATSQVENAADRKILLNGIIRDASTLVPLENTQIKINGSFVSVSDEEGTFIVRVNKRDSIEFSLLGYRPAYFFVSDTLSSSEFLTGVYMRTDTLSIGEVVITPRLSYLRSDILKTPPTTVEMENAKYNLAVSAYQGKVAISRLGDPASNYSVLHQKQRLDAFEKGTIPSDRMVALSPLILIPAAYLLMNGLPEREPPLKSNLTKQELDQIHKKYLETMTKR
jgi:hypothetical protein